jgi:hypothetical protein
MQLPIQTRVLVTVTSDNILSFNIQNIDVQDREQYFMIYVDYPRQKKKNVVI